MRYTLFFIFISNILFSQELKTIIYLIPGQGSDYRIFKNITINDEYETKIINYTTPEAGWNMKQFATSLSSQIDTSRNFIIIGVSLGGMLATEMSEFLRPEKVIIISSAKCRNELPFRYRFQKSIPIYKLFSGNMLKKGAFITQPIVEPDRNKEKETCVSMLKNKDPIFLKRTVSMIINWDKKTCNEKIVHIHGKKDHTIPIKNVDQDYSIEKGSHMMVLTKGQELSTLLNSILKKDELNFCFFNINYIFTDY